jgi:hypothetical protein
MNRYLPLIPAAAAAALLLPLAAGGRASPADPAPQVQPAVLVAAVNFAEADRKAAEPLKGAPPAAAADLDRMAGAAEKVDANRIDPKVALGALAH